MPPIHKESQVRLTKTPGNVVFENVEPNNPVQFLVDLGAPNLRTEWLLQQINTEFEWGKNTPVGGSTKFELTVSLLVASYRHLFIIQEVLSLSESQKRAIVSEDFVSDQVPKGQNAYISFIVTIREPLTKLTLELKKLKIEAQIQQKFPIAN